MNKKSLKQILVPGIIDYNRLFIEACEKTYEKKDSVHSIWCNSEKIVVIKMSNISSIFEECGSEYMLGEKRYIVITMENKFRYQFTYETGTAIKLLWKRSMKHAAPFEYKMDKQNLNSFGGQ